jgi:hypothetical protein
MRKLPLLILAILLGSFIHSRAQPRATCDTLWVDYDVEQEGMRGMTIHLRFSTYNMKDMDAYVAIYFEYNDEIAGYLKDKNGKYNSTEGDVALYRSIKPAYDPADYNDLQLFMPYTELDLEPGVYDLTMDAKVIYKAGGVISRLTYHDFEYKKPGSPADAVSLFKSDAKFEKLRVDYDVTEDGVKGMKIHVNFSISNMKDVDGYVAVYFEKKNGEKIPSENSSYRSKSGQLAVYKNIRPAYAEAVYTDLQLFMPYSAINIPRGRHDLKIDVDIILKNGDMVTHLTEHEFWFER